MSHLRGSGITANGFGDLSEYGTLSKFSGNLRNIIAVQGKGRGLRVRLRTFIKTGCTRRTLKLKKKSSQSQNIPQV